MPANGSGTLTTFVSSSRVRVRLLEDLSKSPMTPTELAYIENKHVSHVSRALSELRANGLVEPVSLQSRERKYRVTIQGLQICADVMKLVR
jgi:DNA-binding transcriptional ArsR family regulator